MVSPQLAAIGLELIVEGVSSFIKDMGAAGGAVGQFKAAISGVKKVVAAVTAPLRALGNLIKNIFTVAAGIIAAQIFKRIAEGISAMVTEAIDAAVAFQSLAVRIETLAAREAFASGRFETFEQALASAQGTSEDLLEELIKLSLVKPISAQTIADTFTLARSYGFATDAALEVTNAVVDFTAGMGLSNVEAQRIILNLGQMAQLGKITTREMTDLGRGALVPISSVLEIIADNLGVTTEKLQDMIRNGIVPAEEFTQAFIQLVDRDFQGASERMGRTIEGLSQRWQNFKEGVIGGLIIRPVLDRIAERTAAIFDTFLENERVIEIANRLGDVFGRIADSVVEFLVPGEEAGARLLEIFEGITETLELLGGTVPLPETALGVFLTKVLGLSSEDAGKTIQFLKDVKDAILNDIIPAIERFVERAKEFGGKILEFFTSAKDGTLEIDWKQLGRDVMNLILDGLEAAGETLGPIITPLFDRLKEEIKEVNWFQLGRDIIDAIKRGIALAFIAFIEFKIGQFEVLRDRVLNQVNWLQLGKDIINFMREGVQIASVILINEVIAIGNNIVAIFNNILAGIGVNIPSIPGVGVTGTGTSTGTKSGGAKGTGSPSPGGAKKTAFLPATAAAPIIAGNNTTINQTFTLGGINTLAKREPIIDDFNTLKSMSRV